MAPLLGAESSPTVTLQLTLGLRCKVILPAVVPETSLLEVLPITPDLLPTKSLYSIGEAIPSPFPTKCLVCSRAPTRQSRPLPLVPVKAIRLVALVVATRAGVPVRLSIIGARSNVPVARPLFPGPTSLPTTGACIATVPSIRQWASPLRVRAVSFAATNSVTTSNPPLTAAPSPQPATLPRILAHSFL